jgi:hypothetical protein
MPYVSELAAMVHPRDGHPKVLAMLDAYFDESGIHDGAEVCLVAGYFGGRGQWRKFEKLWQSVLGDFGLSHFHAKEVVKRRDSYPLQMALAEVIAKCHKISPVAFGIIVPEFFKLPLIERRFMTGATLTAAGKIKESGNPNRPYFAPFQPAIRTVLGYAPVGGKAHFFFGLDTKFGEYAADLYRKLKENNIHQFQERFGTIAFPDAKDTPALQAADLMCHVVYQDMLKRLHDGTLHTLEKEPSDLVRLLLNNKRTNDDINFQDAHMLRETMKEIPDEQRGELLKEDIA